jgi:hypothetical protein
MKLAENTVTGYHLPRYMKQMPQAQDKLFENKKRNVLLAKKHANAMKRVAGIPHNNMTNENVLGRMIPTAMRIKTNTENNYAALHPLLKKNAKKNRDPNFLKNSNKYNHIHVTKNNKTGQVSIITKKKSGGMNTSSKAVTRLRPNNSLKSIPWQWSCPIPSEMQSHQYTGAISSIRLGNDKDNPTKNSEKYVPTGQLLYHSAGSGKTLLMLLTVFFWMMKWWGKVSTYTLPRFVSNNANGSNNISHRGICNLIIFISEKDQVNDLKGQNGIDLFMRIMAEVAKNKSSDALIKFNELWHIFQKNLPERKVVLKFSNEPQSREKINQFKRYPDSDAYGKVQSWRGNGNIAMICKSNHPLFRKVVPTMGMITEPENKYTTRTDEEWKRRAFEYGEDLYAQNFTSTTSKGMELKNKFSHPWRGYAQWNIYLQNVTYAYSVLKMLSASNSELLNMLKSSEKNVKNSNKNMLKIYNEVYNDYNVAKGAYHLFTEEMIVQLYSRVKIFTTRAASTASFSLAGSDGMGANGMRLHYKNIKDEVQGNKGLEDAISEGDFIRFRVGTKRDQQDMDFTNEDGLSELVEACGNHWKEWAQQNKGGVSPFYKVMKTKKIKYGRNKDEEFTFITLQRMMIHALTEHTENNVFDPIHHGDADAVASDKEQPNKSKVTTVKGSNIKKGFQIYDVVRPTFGAQEVDPIETFCDSADMRVAQQTLPSQALKLILANSGAEMRDKKTFQLAPKEQPNGSSDWGGPTLNLSEVGLALSSLWWVGYGGHNSWNIGEDERTKRWEDLQNSTNGKLAKGKGEDFMAMIKGKVMPSPNMPKTLLLGMTSQMALQLFHKLPDGALYIVDEIQKYVGNQDKPGSLSSINNVIERQNFYCMLSEAVKPKSDLCDADKNNKTNNNRNVFSNNKNDTNNKKPVVEKYISFCQEAAKQANNPTLGNKEKDPFVGLPHMKPLRDDSSSGRKFSISPGGGFIQGASATPNIVNLDAKSNSVNELERMWRLIGSCRNQSIPPITRGMLKTKEIITPKGRVIQDIKLVKKVYRKKMERYLKESKVIISFIDLGMDVTKVPLSTRRGRNEATGSSSIMEVDIDMKNRRKRLHNLNFGTGKRVEDRIGYPTMDIKNNTVIPPVKKSDKPAKATKPERTTKKLNRNATPQKTRGNWGSSNNAAVKRTRDTLRNIRALRGDFLT